MPRKLIDHTGQVFGRLTVANYLGTKNGAAKWNCICSCGNEVVVSGSFLRSGNTKSCGCLKKDYLKEKMTVHGMHDTPEYGVWIAMMRRCNNPKDKNYNHYGGRGIRVCSRWQEFQAFIDDMGVRPSPKHSIDRIDVNGGYGPDNCRWADTETQVLNRRISHNNMSGYAGVGWVERLNKWQSRIRVNKKGIYLGVFDRLEDAIKARKDAEIKYRSEAAN